MQLIKTLLLAACATIAFSVALPDAAADAVPCRDLGGVMRIKADELPEVWVPLMFASVLSTLLAGSASWIKPLWLPLKQTPPWLKECPWI